MLDELSWLFGGSSTTIQWLSSGSPVHLLDYPPLYSASYGFKMLQSAFIHRLDLM